jgi:hypothetical protein
MKPPIVFNAGSYLVPFGFGLLVIGTILGWQIGFSIVGIIAVIFYFLLVFVNSVDRGITEFRKKK